MNYCSICAQAIEYFDNQVKICGNETCEFIARTMLFDDNFVFNFAGLKPSEFEFILSLAKQAIDATKFEPVPKYYNFDVDLNDLKLILDAMDIKQDLNNILSMVESADYLQSVGSKDSTIFDTFGPVKYGLIKFVLKSNLMNIKSIKIFSMPDIQTFEVNYFDSNLEGFDLNAKRGSSTYLYHGSSSINWYSIMMNGLRVYSNTPNMTNGNSYGDGIYLSNSFDCSRGYCTKLKTNKSIIGVFEVLGDIKQYQKQSNIFVVNNPQALKLKYILCVSFKFNNINNVVSQKFQILPSIEQTKSTYMTTIRNKRLLKEVAYAMSGKSNQFGLVFNIGESDFYLWNVAVSNIDSDSLLYKDMEQLGIQTIKIEIRFDKQYPIKPPFMRVVEPIFQYRTGNITLGGSICMEMLTTQGWSPACSIESLLIQIKANILETGQLDHTKIGHTYSFEESQIAFKRMMLSHGWT